MSVELDGRVRPALLLLPRLNVLPVFGNMVILRQCGPLMEPRSLPSLLLSGRNGMTLLVPVKIGTLLSLCYVLNPWFLVEFVLHCCLAKKLNYAFRGSYMLAPVSRVPWLDGAMTGVMTSLALKWNLRLILHVAIPLGDR